eukprot:TRINITY_DN11783_c0_g1_i1.p1 TRINITY_DN11783_c0_g1~~TRINITY_DN11783_c0_g1_i1.p1  ORF type:complete len:477 (-),score=57.62 TRINITY_DN11783_c0_g1_i1:19-1449(-)
MNSESSAHCITGVVGAPLESLPREPSGLSRQFERDSSGHVERESSSRLWRYSRGGLSYSVQFGGPRPGGDEQERKIVRESRLLDPRATGRKHRQWLRIHRIHHLEQLYFTDWFHTLLDVPLWCLLIMFFVVYVTAVSALALAFWLIRVPCELEIERFADAFALSVETWLTIGYGVPDQYFRACNSAVIVVTMQGYFAMLVNSFLVGLIFTHMSSGKRRGLSIIFSNNAVIRQMSGRLYLVIQLCELRRTQLLEAHVRLYVVRNPRFLSEAPLESPQAFELRLVRPNDETGALILPVVPTTIVHEIDRFSALGPISLALMPSCSLLQTFKWSEPLARESDAREGGRTSCWCRTCGESFETVEMLRAHVRYMASQDSLSGATIKHDESKGDQNRDEVHDSNKWRCAVEQFLSTDWFEIISVVEGVDAATAATVQTYKSFDSQDIVWDHTFVPCFSVDSERGAEIDFTKIHDLIPAPPE